MAKRTRRTAVGADRRQKRTAQQPVDVEVLFRKPGRAERAPRLTDAAVTRAERELGVRLPRSYVELMKRRNGGRVRLNGFLPTRRPPKWLSGRRVYTLERIEGIGSDESGSIVRLRRSATEWGVPELMVPFDGDGHWWLCLDYRECGARGEPRVTHYEPAEMDGQRAREFRVADSFREFLAGLVFDAGAILLAIDDWSVIGPRMAATMRKLGCRTYRAPGERAGSPPRHWTWKAFATACADEPARLFVTDNGTADAWHLARPASHQLLHVDVCEKDQARCVRELLDAFDDALALIHVPADRNPIPGVPVAEAARGTQRKTRARSAPTAYEPASLNGAVRAGDLTLVRRLLDLGMKPDKRYGPMYATGIETAAQTGEAAIFDLLVGRSGKRPAAGVLDKAIRGGSAAIVRALIDRGLRPTGRDLATAVFMGHTPVVKLLLSLGIEPNGDAIRWAAGVFGRFEVSPSNEPRRDMMRQFRKWGVRATDGEVRRRYERLR
ncbi:MAG TPA: SMI1/KNR4 family protein [Phycisphaerales bacterium]|nr:SMI1/KNR4 family protein [Phycisphaerales bacterium]